MTAPWEKPGRCGSCNHPFDAHILPKVGTNNRPVCPPPATPWKKK